ncbi:MAG: type I-E CRISPR-associated protein Cse2/CasB [Alcanivorax sp.]|nr:type I-E CRISPR-associated protein Cse2/CasB [Alcanivorax sp.]PPD32418.1 MAG: type I-E CRISPR-associated protein Cse2/CasB [Methylomonas sp.]
MTDKIRYQALRDDDLRKVVWSWWTTLQEPRSRGAKAELRRGDSVEAALMTEGFRNLWQALGETGQRNDGAMLAWACVAAVLAGVRDGRPTSFAYSLGSEKERKSGKPYMSELRFAQLQKSRDADAFLRRLRRAVALLDRQAHVLSLADSILHWHREQQGELAHKPTDRLAVRWASDYFTALGTYSR